MTAAEIVSAVRLCFDEEATNDSNLANAANNDDTRMDNIIKSKIGDALTWVCLYSPAELLSGYDGSTGVNFIADMSPSSDVADIVANGDTIGGRCVLATDFLRLIRVRGAGWHRAVITPLSEDSEEYLQLYDANGAKATVERPQAAIVLAAQKKLEVYPKVSFTYTYVKDPIASGANFVSNGANIPGRAKGAFIYYLAFLTLSAYGDPRAPRMLEIAKMNVSRADSEQNK